MGNEAYTEVDLSFLRKTDVRNVKAGILDRVVGGLGFLWSLMISLWLTVYTFFTAYVWFSYGLYMGFFTVYCFFRLLLFSFSFPYPFLFFFSVSFYPVIL